MTQWLDLQRAQPAGFTIKVLSCAWCFEDDKIKDPSGMNRDEIWLTRHRECKARYEAWSVHALWERGTPI